jgi:hypothetical protein
MALEVKGLEQLKRELLKKKRLFVDEVRNFVPPETQKLVAQAAAAAPRASGELASSASASWEMSKTGVEAVAAFTDEKAAAVHEGVHGGKHVEGTGGFKWFEQVFNAFEVGFIERLANRLRAALGGAK